jgi:hypothetical protein
LLHQSDRGTPPDEATPKFFLLFQFFDPTGFDVTVISLDLRPGCDLIYLMSRKRTPRRSTRRLRSGGLGAACSDFRST